MPKEPKYTVDTTPIFDANNETLKDKMKALNEFLYRRSIIKSEDNQNLEKIKSGLTLTKNRKTKDRQYNKSFRKLESRDWFAEYITAPIFKRLLHDKTPIIELVEVPEKDGKKGFEYRSIELENFKTLEQHVIKSSIGGMPPADLKEIENFEKVIASSLFCGDIDYHSENIGVVQDKETGKYSAAKIDHGRSAYRFCDTPLKLGKVMQLGMLEHEYLEPGQKYYRPLDLDKFITAIDEVNNITPEEINQMMSARFYNLQKFQFDIEKIRYNEGKEAFKQVGNQNQEEEDLYPSSSELEDYHQAIRKAHAEGKNIYEAAKNFFVEKYTAQLEVMKEFSKQLKIIRRIDNLDINWQQIVDQDPIEWAIKNNKTISGQDPILWAIENKVKIGPNEPIELAVKYNHIISGQDPILWAMENKVKIGTKDPIELAVKYNHKISGQDPILWAMENKVKIGTKDPIELAVKYNHKISGQDPILWAMENKVKIGTKDPIEWAIKNHQKIDNKSPMSWVLDNLDQKQIKKYIQTAIKSDSRKQKHSNSKSRFDRTPKLNKKSTQKSRGM